MPQRWSYYTHKAEPGLILLLFCSVTIQDCFFYGGQKSDKYSSRETKWSKSYVTSWAATATCVSFFLIGLRDQWHFNIPKFPPKHLFLFHFPLLSFSKLLLYWLAGDFEVLVCLTSLGQGAPQSVAIKRQLLQPEAPVSWRDLQ